MKSTTVTVLCGLLFLPACDELPPMAVGQLESDRVEVVAESNEPIIEIAVSEGDSLAAGDLILRQDTSRIDIRIAEASANAGRIEAMLAEQVSGPRVQTIEAAEASLKEAVVNRDFRERELARLAGLLERKLTSVESVDTAESLYESAVARVEALNAQLEELRAGTRREQVEQTRFTLQQARHQIGALELDRDRHMVRAPVTGTVDALPFEPGERPRPGDPVAVLLTGEQPYARVYIPEPQRVGVRVGGNLSVYVDGLAQPLTGRVRRIASEATFTPYFSLTERDRSRLAYEAEIALPVTDNRLPEGLPVQVYFGDPSE